MLPDKEAVRSSYLQLVKQLLVILPFDASGSTSSDDYGSNYFAHANERLEGMDITFQ